MKIYWMTAAQNAVFVLLLYLPTVGLFYLAYSREYIASDAFGSVRLAILLLFAPVVLKYIIHLLIAPWYPIIERMRSKKRMPQYDPTVSVLIPAWNEEVGILSTIRSVLRTHYPKLEIIVINDGSTDNTSEVVNRFIATHNAKSVDKRTPIIYKSIPNGGKARALNVALEIASGEIIITIDADSVMHNRAIHNLVKHFADPTVASVAGNVAIGNRTRPIGLMQQLEYLYGFYFKRADALFNAVYIVGGAAAAYRKSLIQELGGYDEESITEDIELSTRLQDRGHNVRYAADAIVYTEGPSDFSGLCRQRLRWKYGRLMTFYKYRHLFFSFNRNHNFYLSFFILPIALLAELLLFFEGIFLTGFYVYTFYTNDFVPLVFVICLLTTVVWLQIFSDPQTKYHKNLFMLAPGAWILFYVMDFVEYRALLGSILRIIKKKDLAWQKWSRKGVFDQSSEGVLP